MVVQGEAAFRFQIKLETSKVFKIFNESSCIAIPITLITLIHPCFFHLKDCSIRRGKTHMTDGSTRSTNTQFAQIVIDANSILKTLI